MTYREMWDSFIEPNLPEEVDPEAGRREGEANAVAAAILAGVDLGKVNEALRKDRP